MPTISDVRRICQRDGLERAVLVFVRPPARWVLETRLRERGSKLLGQRRLLRRDETLCIR